MTATPRVSAAEPTSSVERTRATEFTPDAPASPVKEHWYGWQTLSTDSVAAMLASGAIATGGDAEFWGLSIGTFALGAPIIHVAHGRPWVALGDFVLRLGVPFVGIYLGAQIDSHQPWKCDANLYCQMRDTAMITGGLIGGVAVSALDAAVFSYEAPAPEKHRVLASSGPRIAPSVALTPRGGRVALVGSF
jgi:hypothetical protein